MTKLLQFGKKQFIQISLDINDNLQKRSNTNQRIHSAWLDRQLVY